jgi:NAD(P)H dehydrogenase (quinone)
MAASVTQQIPRITVLVVPPVSGNTEKMAQERPRGLRPFRKIVLSGREVIGDDLLSSDAVIVGSPVYVGNMSGQVKTFFDNWGPKFDLGTATGKMRNKVGAAFATGGSISSGKEITILTILGAMLSHQMIVIRGASATTGPDSPGIDAKEIAEARDLGKRVAEVAALVKRGSSN